MLLEQDGLQFPQGTPDIIIDEAIKTIPEVDGGYAYPLVEHIRSDIYCYSMLVSENYTNFMYTFYNNQNYDDEVVVTRTRVDMGASR